MASVMLAADLPAGQHWVTLNGSHVLIDDHQGGKIVDGPKHLVGKTPGEIGKASAKAPAKSPDTASSKAAPPAPWLWEDDEHRFSLAPKDAPTEWQGSLTDEERAAVQRYTTGGYHTLNESLRGGSKLSAEDARLHAHLGAVLDKAGAFPKPQTVWRGVGLSGQGLPSGLELALSGNREELTRQSVARFAAEKFKPGAEVRMPGYQSSSYAVEPALDGSATRGGDGLMFEIRAHRGAYLGKSLSQYDDEDEVLLGHDQRFRVRKVLPDVTFETDSGQSARRTVVQLEQL